MTEEINRLFEICCCVSGVYINDYFEDGRQFTEKMKAAIILENGEQYVYTLRKMTLPNGQIVVNVEIIRCEVGDSFCFNYGQGRETEKARLKSKVVKILLERK
ncbi:hypothetical protein COV49_01530 [Candidatus Falkowbacteria bacterium CG11_big_fil_rev_8_21_14_0_20_39_10]|uniref:Uncharacterized protein n=1 Tax=Candidatus Falkowbacteria bacterium CG11_big_fil_rev_8_21_14_0_20_39_10 TaxID=1974570 RepID=A0A2M6K9E4_9BACT|nr:MAG: hypothetical protein COV49_01530 [Candidatus Falkowbacteria bacterium CG11_big_fil_rev_8_21_14_0_20_39_10]